MHRQMSGSTTVKPKTKTNKIIKKLKDLSFILDSQSPDATWGYHNNSPQVPALHFLSKVQVSGQKNQPYQKQKQKKKQ